MIYLVDKLSSLTKSATRYGRLHICKRLDLGLILMIFLLCFVITGGSLYFFGQGPQPRLNSEVKGILRILTFHVTLRRFDARQQPDSLDFLIPILRLLI